MDATFHPSLHGKSSNVTLSTSSSPLSHSPYNAQSIKKKKRMGNCVGRQVVPTTDTTAGKERSGDRRKQEEVEEEKKAGASTVKVKIVITRKQWKELVSNGDLQSLDAHKLLSLVIMSMKTSGGNVGREKKRWRPSLQKIEEVSAE
ncbi:hypothetical protein MA16_Dca022721 [Dendrobium catenatum]|uniref:Uncharacterized protein n=1 Tax=Dendrobium catenatum TaxID=906689 RepID=A0A2I0WE85_9ASPA|nr:hypothetical protein MA16_Dca022721 [Dendrobium catenatum]